VPIVVVREQSESEQGLLIMEKAAGAEISPAAAAIYNVPSAL
jgi:hypothetical protein